jgi:hypothetical protein
MKTYDITTYSNWKDLANELTAELNELLDLPIQVEHAKFGDGIINSVEVSVSDSTVNILSPIDFNGKIQPLALNIVLARNLIEIPEPAKSILVDFSLDCSKLEADIRALSKERTTARLEAEKKKQLEEKKKKEQEEKKKKELEAKKAKAQKELEEKKELDTKKATASKKTTEVKVSSDPMDRINVIDRNAALSTSSDNANRYLKIGVFSTKQRAYSVKTQIQKARISLNSEQKKQIGKNFGIKIDEVGSLYHVTIGPAKNDSVLNAIKPKLASLGFRDMVIISK